MGRQLRHQLSTGYYHCINRGAGRRTIFHDDRDYETFLHLMRRTLKGRDLSLAAYCLMPNHWHMVLVVNSVTDLSKFFACLLNAHTKSYHACHNSMGHGPIYQGRFKSLYIKDDGVIAACRYVERNPLIAGLVNSASEYPWSSHGYWIGIECFAAGLSLTRPFTEKPSIWRALVDTAMTTAEIEKANGWKGTAINPGVTARA